jgi:hypothetical protein
MSETKVREIRPFTDVLEEVRRGATLDELSKGLNELIEAVVQHQKGGTLTLTVKVKPSGDRQVAIEDAIKVKAPEPGRGVSLFFVDSDANARRDDPAQSRLPLREVGDRNHDNVREINA